MTHRSLISAVTVIGLGVFAPLAASADRSHYRQPARPVHQPFRHGHGAPARFFPIWPRHRYRPVAMPTRAFAGYLYALDELYSDAARLDSLRLDARRLYLSADQTRRILAVMYSDHARLDALRVLATQIVDPENAYVLDGELFSDRSRMMARRILAGARRFGDRPHAYGADLERADMLTDDESVSY